MRGSRSFHATLAGIAITMFAWVSPWEWPATPGIAAMTLLFGRSGYADYPFAVKGAILTGLIALNVTCWALIAWIVTWAVVMLLRRR